MKFLEIVRFELAYQVRRPWPWLALTVVLLFTFFMTRIGIVPVTLPQDFILNSPFIITVTSVFACQVWLLTGPAVAGEAGARDVHTGIHPLVYTSPISRLEYVGGRFTAAFLLNAVILLGAQLGSIAAVYAPGVAPEIIGPFRPDAYLSAYVFVGLTNALIATGVQFAFALLSGRPMASYVGSFLLFFLSYPVTVFFYLSLSGQTKFALLTDPIGVFAIMNEMMSQWTLIEKNVRMFRLEGHMLWNRVLWLGIALATLALTFLRFRFAHRVAVDPLRWFRRRSPVTETAPRTARPVPQVRPSFGFSTALRQLLAITRSSFGAIVMSPAGLFLLIAFPAMLTLVLLVELQYWGIQLLPHTEQLISRYLTAPLTEPLNYWVIVPVLTIFFAGELIWRERDAQLNESVDAAPIPDWALFLGKYFGLALVFTALMAILVLVGVLVQTIKGYQHYQLGLYLQALFGLQLPEYLMFAVLVFAIQVLVNHKYLGQLIALIVYLLIVLAGYIGIQHKLLIFGASPHWSVTQIRGFAGTVDAWLWFKLYWVSWALLLAIATRIIWVRGREPGLRTRLYNARLRFTRSTAGAAAVAVVLIVTLGGFIFYNTNILNEYLTDEELLDRRAEYERKFGQYEGIPQPQRVATNVIVEIHPGARTATIEGSFRLVNRDSVPIPAVHLEPAFYVETELSFDRPARLRIADEDLGHVIYDLEQPLQPGDSLTLDFVVRYAPRGFRNSGSGLAVIDNGSHLAGGALPVIGYQPLRELWSADDRRKYGLPRQVTIPEPGDIDPSVGASSSGTFHAIISTRADQVAVAPGELRRTWQEGDRRFFEYGSSVPISGTEMFFSADYQVFRERWQHVDIQMYLHPGHTKHAERLLRSVRASLEYYSAEFGRYPFPFLQVIEQPGNFFGMGVDGSGVVTVGEGIFTLDPEGDGFDAMFEVMAHEMGHQWWAVQLRPAIAEGGGVISEGLAWYSGIRLVNREKGRDAVRRFMAYLRQPSPWPPIRTGLPLLRAIDPWANYRKAPYVMHALAEYIGEDRVNGALRTLIARSENSLATTLDLYRELQAVTPDSLKPMLHDFFEVNAYWTFDTEAATAVPNPAGGWDVTFEVEVRKSIALATGKESEAPMTEPVEIGIFAAAEPGQQLGKLLHLQKYRVRNGTQTITITVPERPARGGIDPYNLLDWEEGDNIEGIVLQTGESK